MKQIFKFIIACFIFISTAIYGQNRNETITGSVTDATTGEPLPGATINIKGTTVGTITGLDGEYSLQVPDNNSILIFRFIGYGEQEILVGENRVISVELKMNSADLGEVVVTSQARGQIGARQSQINSNTLKNVVAPDRIQENPDANAVEALGRLPGMAVIRSGGEGNQLVIRGMQPSYTNVTLNGINVAGGQAVLSNISQFALQGAEVFKASTPDLESNAVGGTINLTTQDAREGLHFSAIAQTGYNDLNSDFGNYKFVGDISNRFFNNKLGISLSGVAERVNRSTQTMSAGYGIQGEEIDILLNSSSLNLIEQINTRRSANVSVDYSPHSSTKLKLHSMYAYAGKDSKRQSKNYSHTGAGGASYSMAYNPDNINTTLHSALSGKTNTRFLNMELDYGVIYSQNKGEVSNSRSWSFPLVNVSSSDITTVELRRLSPTELIPLFSDDVDGASHAWRYRFTSADSESMEKDITGHLDLKLPFKIGDAISGHFKFGGKYRHKSMARDGKSGYQEMNNFNEKYWYEAMPWLIKSELSNYGGHNLIGFENGTVDDFLGGEFNYGTIYDFDKLNQTTDWWENFSDSLYSLGYDVWVPMLGGKSQVLSYVQNIQSCMFNDIDANQDYYAGYLMGEFNIGKWLMFMPGFRYEKTRATLNGKISVEPNTEALPYYFQPVTGTDTSTIRSDEFFLPMFQMRISPLKFAYIHLAYTQSLKRPDFSQISPNVYVNPQTTPFSYSAKNPRLKTEHWTNYDAQITFHSLKLGLLSVSGFYKTVEDKIWSRSYQRLKGDPIVEPWFTDRDVINMSVIENHPYDVSLYGLEFEWQTSFWYLPNLLKYFTFNVNYTYTGSETDYPLSWQESVVPPQGGRPVRVRRDSVITGVMLMQPKHIINTSLGFNYKGLNSWLSFQYNGQMYTSKDYHVQELDRLKEHFYRLDLQLTYDLPVKLPGKMQLIGNFGNLTNFNEVSRLKGDPRFTYQEAYGFTIDLGVRYSL